MKKTKYLAAFIPNLNFQSSIINYLHNWANFIVENFSVLMLERILYGTLTSTLKLQVWKFAPNAANLTLLWILFGYIECQQYHCSEIFKWFIERLKSLQSLICNWNGRKYLYLPELYRIVESHQSTSIFKIYCNDFRF